MNLTKEKALNYLRESLNNANANFKVDNTNINTDVVIEAKEPSF